MNNDCDSFLLWPLSFFSSSGRQKNLYVMRKSEYRTNVLRQTIAAKLGTMATLVVGITPKYTRKIMSPSISSHGQLFWPC